MATNSKARPRWLDNQASKNANRRGMPMRLRGGFGFVPMFPGTRTRSPMSPAVKPGKPPMAKPYQRPGSRVASPAQSEGYSEKERKQLEKVMRELEKDAKKKSQKARQEAREKANAEKAKKTDTDMPNKPTPPTYIGPGVSDTPLKESGKMKTARSIIKSIEGTVRTRTISIIDTIRVKRTKAMRNAMRKCKGTTFILRKDDSISNAIIVNGTGSVNRWPGIIQLATCGVNRKGVYSPFGIDSTLPTANVTTIDSGSPSNYQSNKFYNFGTDNAGLDLAGRTSLGNKFDTMGFWFQDYNKAVNFSALGSFLGTFTIMGTAPESGALTTSIVSQGFDGIPIESNLLFPISSRVLSLNIVNRMTQTGVVVKLYLLRNKMSPGDATALTPPWFTWFKPGAIQNSSAYMSTGYTYPPVWITQDGSSVMTAPYTFLKENSVWLTAQPTMSKLFRENYTIVKTHKLTLEPDDSANYKLRVGMNGLSYNAMDTAWKEAGGSYSFKMQDDYFVMATFWGKGSVDLQAQNTVTGTPNVTTAFPLENIPNVTPNAAITIQATVSMRCHWPDPAGTINPVLPGLTSLNRWDGTTTWWTASPAGYTRQMKALEKYMLVTRTIPIPKFSLPFSGLAAPGQITTLGVTYYYTVGSQVTEIISTIQ